MRFFELKLHQNPFSDAALPRTLMGSIQRSPKPSSRLGGGHPLPDHPLGTLPLTSNPASAPDPQLFLDNSNTEDSSLLEQEPASDEVVDTEYAWEYNRGSASQPRSSVSVNREDLRYEIIVDGVNVHGMAGWRCQIYIAGDPQDPWLPQGDRILVFSSASTGYC